MRVLATVGVSNLVDHGVHRFVTGKAEADADAALSISVVLNQVAESEDAATAAVVVDTAGWVKNAVIIDIVGDTVLVA